MRLEAEKEAEAARLEAEMRAETARREVENQAEAARLEKAARAEAERLENEARAEDARIAREKRAEEIRLENERRAAEKAERERQKAIEAAAAEERKRIAREEAAAQKMRADQARREEAARQRAEQERLALDLAERRRKDQEETAARKAERKRLSSAQKQAAKAEKVRRAAERPPSAGFTAKFSGWFGAKKTEPVPDPRWTMVIGESHTPQSSAESTETSTAVASADPSWNDTPMTETPRPPEPLEPAPTPPTESGDGALAPRIPDALRELNELVERESPAPGPDSLDHAKPAARGGGGRSAQMLVEDAADDRARDRMKNWGRETPAGSETPASETRARELPPREPDPVPEGIPETMTAPLDRRRGPGRTIALFFVLATIATAALMTSDRWIPLLDGAAETPVATAPAPQVKPIAPTPTPAGPSSTPGAPVTSTPAPAPQLPAGDTNQVIAALMARIATLEAALGNTVGLDEINRRVGALEGKSADANSVLALADRVTALEQGARSAADARAVAVALTIAGTQWREAIVTGRPFLKEWDTVKALTGDTSAGGANTVFAPYASTGLPVLADLQRRFDVAAAAAVRASYIPNDTASWLRRTLDRVLSVVTVRRTDLDTGDEIDAVLVRAERAVDANNLPGAIAEMRKLTGASLTAAGPWITLAEARVAAEEAAQQTVIDGTTALAAPVAPAAPVAAAPVE